ncbi:Dual specificity protein phosphatase 12 [Halotydeus destructor]|nr:Dual specificity protein phosphatase 12 [Halotydeus destructor]
MLETIGDLSFIQDNLILSGVEVAMDREKLSQLRVSHMVTVDITPLSPQPMANYLFIPAADHHEDDLLSFFPTTCNFIESALNHSDSVVLVHCVAGCSRSATIIMAYIMKTHKISFRDALVYVITKRPMVDPNAGFREQLALWERMGYELDIANANYRHILLANLSYKIKKASPTINELANSRRKQNFNMMSVLSKGDEMEVKERTDIICKYFCKLRTDHCSKINNSNTYKCKKCRRFLFKEINVAKTNSQDDDAMAKEDVINCTAIYVEPLEWMMPSIATQREGLIVCPYCRLKIGGFDWNGTTCSVLDSSGDNRDCPKHSGLVPAFKLDTKKVDIHYH